MQQLIKSHSSLRQHARQQQRQKQHRHWAQGSPRPVTRSTLTLRCLAASLSLSFPVAAFLSLYFPLPASTHAARQVLSSSKTTREGLFSRCRCRCRCSSWLFGPNKSEVLWLALSRSRTVRHSPTASCQLLRKLGKNAAAVQQPPGHITSTANGTHILDYQGVCVPGVPVCASVCVCAWVYAWCVCVCS